MGCGDIGGFADPGFGLITGSGPFASGSKKKPYAKIPGGKLTWRGQKILAAGNELLPGTLDLTARGAQGFGDIYRSEAEKTRADEISAFEKYGPRYVEAIDNADPLRARAKEIILANLDQGLDPAMAREVTQGSRGAYAARGLAYSPASAIDELLTLGRAGKELETLNLNEALKMTSQTDPFLAFAGRPSAPQGSEIMSPNYASYSNDLPSFQANQELQAFNAAQASKNRTNQLIGAGISAIGNIGGGALGFI